MDKDKIKMMFKLMEYDYISEKQHDLIVSFEEQFLRNKMLSEYQCEILEDIFNRAAESVE